jgi:hypothetical protein
MLTSFAAVPFALSGAAAAALLSLIRLLNGVASAWVEATMMAVACNFLPDSCADVLCCCRGERSGGMVLRGGGGSCKLPKR